MNRLARANHGNSHSYTIDDRPVPGVTTVIGKVLDKPALVGWAANTTAAYAIDNWSRLSEMPIATRLDVLQKSRFTGNKSAIQRGHRIHAMAEAMQHGQSPDCPPEFVPDVQAIARLLDQWQAEPVATEAPVASTVFGYAGTLDTILRIPRLGGVVMCDFKTGSGVYSEAALQLSAYARSDVLLTRREVVGPRGGKSVVWDEGPMVTLDDPRRGYVIHAKDGVAELRPVDIDAEVFDVFVGVLDLYHSWYSRTSWEARGSDSFRPVVHDAIYPEVTAAPSADAPPY